jgi:hypothetical protein
MLTDGCIPIHSLIQNNFKMKRNLILLLSIAVLFITGCEKKPDESKPSPLVGSWKKMKVEKKTLTSNWVIDNRTCYTDDIEEFGSAGDWTSFDGTMQCSAGTGIIKGSWKFAAGETKIIFKYEGYTGEYESTVETLTENSLVLTQSSGDLANTQVRTTYQK